MNRISGELMSHWRCRRRLIHMLLFGAGCIGDRDVERAVALIDQQHFAKSLWSSKALRVDLNGGIGLRQFIYFIGAYGYLVGEGARSRPPQWK